MHGPHREHVAIMIFLRRVRVRCVIPETPGRDLEPLILLLANDHVTNDLVPREPEFFDLVRQLLANVFAKLRAPLWVVFDVLKKAA